MHRIWILLGAVTTALVLAVAAPCHASARGVNLPGTGGDDGSVHPPRRPVTVVRHDSRIPTYDYYVVTFDRRATYEIGRKARTGALLVLLLGKAFPAPQVKALSLVVGALGNRVRSLAQDAEHHAKCLAGRVYVQRRKLVDPPGPDVLVAKVYATRSRCAGSYTRG